MKKEIHPQDYRPVLFIDSVSGVEYIIPSTVHSTETATSKATKKEYPVVRIEISSSSHPFYTGQEKVLDSAGRVEKFKQKQAKAAPKTKKSSAKK